MSSEPRNTSPLSDHLSDGMDTLSMRDKALLKRSVSKHHNNNLKAGYVPVHEQYLHKTGIRGRKTFAFWALMSLLFMLAVGNLILTSTILGVLRLGQGMENLELISEDSTIKFFGDTDLGYIYKSDGKLEGFLEVPIQIVGENGSIMINIANRSVRNVRANNVLKMSRNETVFRNVNTFEVKNSNGKSIFRTHKPAWHILTHIQNIQTEMVQTNKIVSPVDDKLILEAKNITLKGTEGTSVEGKEILWSADQNIYLNSVNGSIMLSGKEGVYLDIKRIPIALPKHTDVTGQYKVCICMPQGKLFRIPVPKNAKERIFCHHINSLHDPCI